jgi:hypothetical protein
MLLPAVHANVALLKASSPHPGRHAGSLIHRLWGHVYAFFAQLF